jgi:hypothetical protein
MLIPMNDCLDLIKLHSHLTKDYNGHYRTKKSCCSNCSNGKKCCGSTKSSLGTWDLSSPTTWLELALLGIGGYYGWKYIKKNKLI